MILLKYTGKTDVTTENYREPVLEPDMVPAFLGLLGSDQSSGDMYVEVQPSVPVVKPALIQIKKSLGITMHSRPC